MDRILIINADDFGQSPGINEGIIKAVLAGRVTSASLMARWPGAREAADFADKRKNFSLGLHLDFGEWYRDRDWEWKPQYTVIPMDDAALVREEAYRQLELFIKLAGHAPTHIDSHQHVHLKGHLKPAAADMAAELGVPLRGATGKTTYSGKFYGQSGDGEPYLEGISEEHLVKIIGELPEGWTELGCHPAARADFKSMYRDERLAELKALTGPNLPAVLSSCGVKLSDFSALKGL